MNPVYVTNEFKVTKFAHGNTLIKGVLKMGQQIESSKI